MQALRNTTPPGFVNLKQLPKDKPVLDYVLDKLSKSCGPEKFEVISAVFDMYRTSTGFDPITLSKGRIKRIKSGEIKNIIRDIDHELGIIFNTEIYKQLLAIRANYPELFKSYLTLSDELKNHPNSTMLQDVQAYEEQLQKEEAPEILLSFYRRHFGFFKETRTNDDDEIFLKQFDAIVESNKHCIRITRSGLLLEFLEKKSIKGKPDYERILELWNELGQLLTLESNYFTKFDLLIKIIRCGMLTVTPARNLESYLLHAEENINEILHFYPGDTILLYIALSKFHPNASIDKRKDWLLKADQVAKEQGLDECRASFRLIQAGFAMTEMNIDLALRYLNEAEHFIHRARGADLSTRNTWISICDHKIILFAIQHILGKGNYTTDDFSIPIRLLEDIGAHRHDHSVLCLEMKALVSFVFLDWDSALESFNRAVTYRKSVDQTPHLLLDEFYSNLLDKNQKKKIGPQVVALNLQELKSPFYSATFAELVQQSYHFFRKNISGKEKAAEK